MDAPVRQPDPQHDVTHLAALEGLFDAVKEVSILKEIDHVDANYAAWIAASPFCVLGTAGPEGLDCSPRGDAPGFVRLLDDKTLLLPDRRGNNRIDSLRNIVADPRVALLFFIPGQGETLRVNGRCRLSADPALCADFVMQGKLPKLVLVVSVEAVFFQCSRALVRSRLWDAETHLTPGALPTPGQVLSDISRQQIDGAEYDRELPGRVKATLY
jgi:PPOX class probable FMN-dependent enzyme